MLHIVSSWIPSLNGGKVEEKLRRSSNGTKVADVGCGHGVSTIIMAKTYPNSKFIDLITINRLLKQHVKEQKKKT
jgi:ubiquinone/menaquinone biosynthesis C-methylase UbiE